MITTRGTAAKSGFRTFGQAFYPAAGGEKLAEGHFLAIQKHYLHFQGSAAGFRGE
jgi:hypothetical protein